MQEMQLFYGNKLGIPGCLLGIGNADGFAYLPIKFSFFQGVLNHSWELITRGVGEFLLLLLLSPSFPPSRSFERTYQYSVANAHKMMCS